MSARGVLRNFSFLAGGRVLGDFFTFLFLIVLSRRFGPQGVGEYGVAAAIGVFLAVGADFGLHALTVKELSRRDAPADLPSRVLSLRLLFSAPAVALVLMAPLIPGLPERTGWVVLVIGLHQLLYRAADGLAGIFVAREEPQVSSALEVACRGLGALGAVAVMASGGSLPLALAALPAAAAVQLGLTLFLLRRRLGRLGWHRDRRDLARTAREARPYALSALLTQLSTRVDVVAIGLLLGAGPAGLYHAAYRIVAVLLWIPQLAALALLPLASRTHGDRPDALAGLGGRALGGMVLIGVPAGVGLLWIAPGLVGALFGEAFAPSVRVLRLLAPLILLECLARIMGVFLMASDRQGARARQQWKAAWTNLAGNLLLIPLFGIEGAALAALLAHALLVGLFAAELSKSFGRLRIGSRVALASVGAAAFSGVLALLPELALGATVAVGVGVYAGTLLLFPGFRSVEAQALWHAWRAPPSSHETETETPHRRH